MNDIIHVSNITVFTLTNSAKSLIRFFKNHAVSLVSLKWFLYVVLPKFQAGGS